MATWKVVIRNYLGTTAGGFINADSEEAAKKAAQQHVMYPGETIESIKKWDSKSGTEIDHIVIDEGIK